MRPVNTDTLAFRSPLADTVMEFQPQDADDEAEPANDGEGMEDVPPPDPQSGQRRRADHADIGGDEAGSRRKRVALERLEHPLRRLERLLAASYDPGGAWPLPALEAQARRLEQAIGTGYTAATAALIERTGPYCAYCEAAQPSGLQADPIKPAKLFPLEAFLPAGLLLACTACRAGRARAMRSRSGVRRLNRRLGDLRWDDAPINPAWPHLYWKPVPPERPLPFVNRLYESVDPAGPGEPVAYPRMRQLAQAYRRGQIEVERGGGHAPRLVLKSSGEAEPPTAEAAPAQLLSRDREALEARRAANRRQPPAAAPGPVYYLRAFVEPEEGQLGAAIRATIDMLDLNSQAPNSDDRRQELRTSAYLSALDFRERFGALAQLGDAAAIEAMRALLGPCIQATGFWSVWVTVLGQAPNLGLDLNALLPGTVAMPRGL
jgi:hypothetical protein